MRLYPLAGQPLGLGDLFASQILLDSDLVMVGEIRDRETAEIAMGAAVTGHLVLSTIGSTRGANAANFA